MSAPIAIRLHPNDNVVVARMDILPNTEVESGVAAATVLALESLGFIMLARDKPWAAVVAGALIAYFLLLNGPVASPKYRLPMEPMLIVLAAIPLARWSDQRTRTRCDAQKRLSAIEPGATQASPA